MAVRKKRRRGHRQSVSAGANQKSFFHLAMAILALVMVLSMGDNFATSAAGCYGAITEVPQSKTTDETTEEKPEKTVQQPVFKVKENTP